jgi:flagellin-like protein
MMKKMWKNRSGVSPVIATILMVAITVVLAAVLYVMVMGFGTSSSAPTAAIDGSATSTTHQEKIVVTSISSPQLYADMKVSLVFTDKTTTGGASGTYVVSMSGTTTATLTPSPAMVSTTVGTITFVDLAADGKVSTGDYFLVTGVEAGDAFTMNLLYGSDSTSIASESWTVA